MAVKCEEHSGCVSEITNLKESDKLQWSAINKLQNRLPVWATLMMTGLGTCIGVLSGFLIAITNLKG